MATTRPGPNLTPQDVVRIQLSAMQHNDAPLPDSGLAVAFAFASPKNQAMTGPLEKFATMVKGPEYGPMINARSIEYGQIHEDQAHARQLVKITGADGADALFLFILSKQTDGKYKDCWLTDGVVRLRPEDMQAAPPPAPGNNGDGHDRV